MAFVNPATAGITVGAVDSHHLLGLYQFFWPINCCSANREKPNEQRQHHPFSAYRNYS
jgi:hypothetical protein